MTTPGKTEPAATQVSSRGAATIVSSAAPVLPEQKIDTGSELNNRFVLLEKLGQGGMGSVFRARDRRREEAGDPNPFIAIKLITGSFLRDPRAFVALQRETGKSQSLAHPNIVKVYDFDRDGDVFFMTMECLQGQSLDTFILAQQQQPVPVKTTLAYIEEIAIGVAHAHLRGIVHSDLKPQNIFLTTNQEVRILDFGIARASSTFKQENRLPDDQEVVGLTPAYASCEMFAGEAPHPGDDVYALGLIAYEMLTGQHPYQRVAAKDISDKAVRPKKIPGLKAYQNKTIQRALRLERQYRQTDASQFLRQFTGAGRRIRRLSAALAISLVALTATLVFYEPDSGPAIPFADLPPALQQQVSQKLQSGQEALRFGDYNGALFLLDQAYQLHPGNREAVTELDAVVTGLLQTMAAQEPPMPVEQRRQAVEELLKYESLSQNKTLVDEQNRLLKTDGR